MPLYEYECNACGEHCEILQKISDPLATECPHCKENTLKRLVSATSFQLKGSGWYVTDFRDKNKPKQKEAKETKTSDKKTEATKKETKE
ncbi:FmdB family zinc ribbon protein [Candidiatus Paracoxiella cheracis]|uniref:FmdB family zinc ribbon protein n=1 Tax=Candidiatus Paracoxiella cheracis TaxID=3405120 RepID=UPI003BF4C659